MMEKLDGHRDQDEYRAAQPIGKGPLDPPEGDPLPGAIRSRAPFEAIRSLGVALQLDRSADQPLHAQLSGGILDAIDRGQLIRGVRLPSTRELADALDVSRNVISQAYGSLELDGKIEMIRGSGTFVAGSGAPESRPVLAAEVSWLSAQSATREGRTQAGRVDLRLRGGSFAPLPDSVWRQAWRAAASDLPSGYDDPAGDELLRDAIAGFVSRIRGIPCSAADVVVTAGASDALQLLLRATLRPGDGLAIEDPGYPGLSRMAGALDVPITRLGVDEMGADLGPLEVSSRSPVAVHLTPSHQFPLCAELSASRRDAVLGWASLTGGLIIENDYNGEFRFTSAAQPTLAALDGFGHVCFVGTFSRLLTPALRLGYLVATPALAERIAQLKRDTDHYASFPTERAVAQLILSGELERHLRRVRAIVDYKRARIASALGDLEGVRIHGLDGGLHVLIEAPGNLPVARLAELARRRGVMVEDLRSFYEGPPMREGLLLDYSAAEVKDLETGLVVMRELVQA